MPKVWKSFEFDHEICFSPMMAETKNNPRMHYNNRSEDNPSRITDHKNKTLTVQNSKFHSILKTVNKKYSLKML